MYRGLYRFLNNRGTRLYIRSFDHGSDGPDNIKGACHYGLPQLAGLSPESAPSMLETSDDLGCFHKLGVFS